jgi:hypothetical protein
MVGGFFGQRSGIALWMATLATCTCLAEPRPDANKYRLSQSSLSCLLANRAKLAKLALSPIILDVSVCPPRGLDIRSAMDVQANTAAPVANMGVEEAAKTDSLLIIPRVQLPCFIARIEELQRETADIVTLDLTSCGAQTQ